MQIKLLMLWIVFCVCAACAPEKKCSGDFVYKDDNLTCVPCPMGAKFKDGTCICPAGSEYVNFVCKKGSPKGDAGASDMEDAGPPTDSGAKTGGGATCVDYCSFVNTCIGMNGLAPALGTLSADLHATDQAECKTSCQSDLGNKEQGNAALACMKTAGEKAMCKDPNPQNGLKAAFGVIEECCGTRGSDPLCKSICNTLTSNSVLGSMITFCP